MDISWMRDRVKNVPKYANSDSWRLKVDKMSDNQVIAIYHNFLERNMYRSKKKPKVTYEQLTLYDIFPEVMRR